MHQLPHGKKLGDQSLFLSVCICDCDLMPLSSVNSYRWLHLSRTHLCPFQLNFCPRTECVHQELWERTKQPQKEHNDLLLSFDYLVTDVKDNTLQFHVGLLALFVSLPGAVWLNN